MVAGCGHGRAKPTKNGSAIVLHFAGFAMHKVLGANYVAAECSSNCLMSKADSQNGHLSGQRLDKRDADASILRSAGPGREHDPLRAESLHLLDTDLIIALYLNYGP